VDEILVAASNGRKAYKLRAARFAVTAEAIAKALGGRRSGHGWIARCPAHDDHNPSLSICDGRNGKVLVYCHAGCDQRQVIAALRARGLWGAVDAWASRFTPQFCPSGEPHLDREERKRAAAARAIWQTARPPGGTLVQIYLRSRCLHLPPQPALRFHPELKHPSGSVWPAMIAVVRHVRDHALFAVHRTFLARDGSTKAPVEEPKRTLAQCGGGAVQLAAAGEHLAIAEGIETALSVLIATGVPTWAAGSAGGVRRLVLPPLPLARKVTICADHDPAGLAAAYDAAERWHREGRQVRIAIPPEPGTDFNDLALATEPAS
jgi:putative DNA primase/helicase